MKKIAKILFLFVLLVSLTGCGSSLICKRDDETAEVIFSGDKVVKYIVNISFDSNEDANREADYFKNYGSVKIDGKKLTVVITDESTLKRFFDGKKRSDLKKDAENKGYKCN